MTEASRSLQQRFVNDPEFHELEQLILSYIQPLLDMSTVDTKQPAEHVKAEIIGRLLAHGRMIEFLQQSKIIKNIPAQQPTTFK